MQLVACTVYSEINVKAVISRSMLYTSQIVSSANIHYLATSEFRAGIIKW